MKRLLFLILLGAFTVHAQTFTDDLATKRSNLIWLMRDLGPLQPDDWVDYSYDYVVNGEDLLDDYTYHPMGAFWNVGLDGYELVMYCYNPAGNNLSASTEKESFNLFFSNFGLHLTTDSGYASTYLSMDSASYNVAGLKYNSLAIGTGLDASGDLIGYTIDPGQNFYLGSYTGIYVYDLLQETETPSFKVADYYFGLYPNLPPDSKLPAPQDTQSQSSGLALLANGVGTTNLLIGWAKEGVYRPEFALPPGYSSPLLYTYMQQYFDGPFLTDPTTGTVPRTSTLNWNGIGEIDTNDAVRTGLLSPSGYFIPTQPGKQIIVTRPLENGYYGEWPFYALQMQVDENRDGVLDSNDVTSVSSPHIFWVNNDCDRVTYSTDDDWDEQDIPTNATTVNDAQFVVSKSRIPSLRDLEDYDRLDIRGLNQLCEGLPTRQSYTVILHWKTILSGNPGIFVFQSADASGGTAYLADPTVAATQIYPTLYPTNATEPGASSLAIGLVDSSASAVLIDDSVGSIGDFFIYCGTSRGSGELAVSVYKDSTLIGETSIFLDIRDVKELYERWTLGDSNGGTPNTSPMLVGDGLPSGVPDTLFNDPTSSGQNYILFVHGWNMSPFDKDAFAETTFKRLYWQGYTNRFGVLRWPTTYGFNESAQEIIFDAHSYDNGEIAAWHSAEGLRQLLLNLNVRYPGRVYLLAHSMGNIVAGEALALNAEKYGGGKIVNVYVASQAAVPVNCYDANATTDDPNDVLDFFHTPSFFGGVPALWDSGTANVYPGWLSTNMVSCGARVNFYNTNDWALSPDVWQFDETAKPDSWGLTYYRYEYTVNYSIPSINGGSSGSAPAFIIPSPARKGPPQPLLRFDPGIFAYTALGGFDLYYLDFEYNLNDMYEVMAYASEARTLPLGRYNDPNALLNEFNLDTIWGTDDEPDPQWGIFGRRKWHSAEFNFNYAMQESYWHTLLGPDGFKINLQ